MTFLYWFLLFLLSLSTGIILASLLSSFLLITEKKKENFKIIMKNIIGPCLLTGLAIGFIIVLSKDSKSPIELLILAAIFCSGLLSIFPTKQIILFFISLFLIILYLLSKSLVLFITLLIKQRANKIRQEKTL